MLRASMVLILLAFSPVAAAAATSPPLPPQPHLRPHGLPRGALMLSPCIASMGEHWGDPKRLPNGPFYGVADGKLVFTELMIPVAQLERGFTYANMRALPGKTIDHVDFEFEPHGHPGVPMPHYDLHEYYVSPAVEATICPNGIRDDAMKPMSGP